MGRRLRNKAIKSTTNVDTNTAPTTPVKSQPPTPVGVKSKPCIHSTINTAVAFAFSVAEVLSKSATPLAVKQQVVPPVADSTSTLAVPPVAEDSPALLKKTGKRIMNKALPKSTTPISSPIIPAAVTNDSDAEEKEEAELARKKKALDELAAETKRKSEEEAAKKVALEKAMAENTAAEAAEKQVAEESATKQAEEERIAEEKRQAEEAAEKIAAQKAAEKEKVLSAAVCGISGTIRSKKEDTAKNGEVEQGKHEDQEDLSEAAKAEAKKRRKKEKKVQRKYACATWNINHKMEQLAELMSVSVFVGKRDFQKTNATPTAMMRPKKTVTWSEEVVFHEKAQTLTLEESRKTCKYNHPNSEARYRPKGGRFQPIANVQVRATGVNSMGYPLRPGAQPCVFYMKSGQCTFAQSCNFDHPDKPEMMPMAGMVNMQPQFAPMGASVAVNPLQQMAMQQNKTIVEPKEEPQTPEKPPIRNVISRRPTRHRQL